MRNQILKNAKAVTTVSPYHVEKLSKYNNEVNLIYNGYDPDLFKPESDRKDKHFLYYIHWYLFLRRMNKIRPFYLKLSANWKQIRSLIGNALEYSFIPR